ncbi:hypothetical protein Ahia01_001334500 [Argonauta hians]
MSDGRILSKIIAKMTDFEEKVEAKRKNESNDTNNIETEMTMKNNLLEETNINKTLSQSFDIPEVTTSEGDSTDTVRQEEDNGEIPSIPSKPKSTPNGTSYSDDFLLSGDALDDGRVTPIKIEMVNVFAKYSICTWCGGIFAVLTALFGICHLIYVGTQHPLGDTSISHMLLDLGMTGSSVLLVYKLCAYLRETWTYGKWELIAGLLFSFLTVACSSIMILIDYEPIIITAILSSLIVLVFWAMMGAFHYRAYCDL